MEREASMAEAALVAAVSVGAEVKVFMGVDSAVAASATVAGMPRVRTEGASRKARVEALLLRARTGTELLKGRTAGLPRRDRKAMEPPEVLKEAWPPRDPRDMGLPQPHTARR